MNNPKPRILREVTAEQDHVLKILEIVKYATIDNIKTKDGKIRVMEIKIRVDFDHPEEFKQILEELKSIPLL